MDPNQNPPSEREWTQQEKEEFFSSQDAMTLASNGSAEWPWWMQRGIFITSIVPPEHGWPIVAHCVHCRKTEIVLSPWAKKPDDGDYFLLKGTCLDDELNMQHNMYPQFDYPNPSRMGPRPEEWTEEAYKHYWNPLGVPK